jgi:cell division protein FtsI (penicillin-binding protein 3)
MAALTLVSLVVQSSLVFALSLGAAAVLPQKAASLRRWLLLLGVASTLALPLLSWAAEGRQIVHVAAPRVVAHVFAEALSTTSASPVSFVSRARVTPLPDWDVPWASALLAVWLGVALLLVLRTVLSSAAAARLARAATVGESGLLYCTRIEGPVVVGAFLPAILLPVAAKAWDAERLRVVLLHETAHVRRRDGLALLVARLACAAYWFQPLAWLALARLRQECELAADEDVLAAGIRATSYAEHLLAVARSMRVPASAVAMAARPSELGRRIRVLVARDRVPTAMSNVTAGLLAAVAALVLSAIACTGAEPLSPVAVNRRRAASVETASQKIAVEEANRARSESGAHRVAVLVLDSQTGRVLASTDDQPGAPVVPASTLKPLTVAVALDARLISAEQRFDCGNGERAYGEQTLRDAGQYGMLDSAEILAVSSNIGLSRIFDALGAERLRDGLQRFHVETPAELPSNALRGAILAMGEGSTTTPLALASAYTVFANDGVYTAPGTTRAERVIKAETARSLRNMLEGVVTGERATGRAARVNGVRVGGKTGTSDDPDCEACAQGPGLFASFVGIVPIDRPRYVIYVGVGQPARPGTGGSLAAPVFARIASRLLVSG